MKKIIISAVIAILLIAGGTYWYLEIYQPKQFAQKIVVIYRDFQVGIRSVGSDQSLSGQDVMMERYKMATQEARAKLNAIKPPREMKSIHKDFLEFLDVFQLFISSFKSGGFDQTLNEKEQEQARRGNDLDSKIQELIKTYPDLKSLTE